MLTAGKNCGSVPANKVTEKFVPVTITWQPQKAVMVVRRWQKFQANDTSGWLLDWTDLRNLEAIHNVYLTVKHSLS